MIYNDFCITQLSKCNYIMTRYRYMHNTSQIVNRGRTYVETSNTLLSTYAYISISLSFVTSG